MSCLHGAPLDLEALHATVRRSDRGAVATFVGQVRDHHAGRVVTSLSYSAYGPMAERICQEILTEAEGRWSVAVALAHRIGSLDVGDDAVAVVVAAAHRSEAFEACRWVIEEVKQRVPIWKRERYADGTESWVDPTAPEGVQPAASQ